MALALFDALTPWRSGRLSSFLAHADRHAYMVHVGAGWAIARLPWRRRVIERQLDPLLLPLAYDGYGFHHAYFHTDRFVRARERLSRLRPAQAKAFDQGIGRALWFVEGADPAFLESTIATFERTRRADLWSGVGLAAAYACGVDEETLQRLVSVASGYGAELAQGAAFAAKARIRAGNPTDETERACAILCGMTADAAAALTDRMLAETPGHGHDRYEGWRQAIRGSFPRVGAIREASA